MERRRKALSTSGLRWNVAEYDYTIEVRGNDWSAEEGWAPEHYHICEIPMDGMNEAILYLLNITKEQALEWERKSRCNGVDILVFADEVDENGVYTLEFNVVAECEWIGDGRNGVWVGFDRIA